MTTTKPDPTGQTPMMSKEDVEKYWRNPGDRNIPRHYITGKPKSQYLFGILSSYVKPTASVLEVGCNVGRNLNYLLEAGFTDLTGVDINPDLPELIRKTFPKLAERATLHIGPAEVELPKIQRQFDVVFTMAVLMHVHNDVFPVVSQEMARLSKKYILTIEDEINNGAIHKARNYRSVFGALGFHELMCEDTRHVPGLHAKICARLFQRVEEPND